jgi:hypothetical protein
MALTTYDPRRITLTRIGRGCPLTGRANEWTPSRVLCASGHGFFASGLEVLVINSFVVGPELAIVDVEEVASHGRLTHSHLG